MSFETHAFQQLRKLLKDLKGSTILIGVSGGIDSMMLLHLIHAHRHSLSIRLHAAHYNHHLRKSSERDQKLVIKFCKMLAIPLITGERPISKTIKKISEDQARKLRYCFFCKAYKQTHASGLVLAHHQNDQAETVLMRILRGTGLDGLKAMPSESNMLGMKILRPLISLSRSDIENYAKRYQVPSCYDETNDSTEHERNKIRHELIPFLTAEFNPQAIQALSRLAECVAEDYAFILFSTEARLKEYIVIDKRTVKIKTSFFNHQPIAIRRMALRVAIKHFNVSEALSFDHVDNILKMIDQQDTNVSLNLPQKIIVTLTKDDIGFTR